MHCHWWVILFTYFVLLSSDPSFSNKCIIINAFDVQMSTTMHIYIGAKLAGAAGAGAPVVFFGLIVS